MGRSALLEIVTWLKFPFAALVGVRISSSRTYARLPSDVIVADARPRRVKRFPGGCPNCC